MTYDSQEETRSPSILLQLFFPSINPMERHREPSDLLDMPYFKTDTDGEARKDRIPPSAPSCDTLCRCEPLHYKLGPFMYLIAGGSH
jgi:hypothetical protein